MDTGVFRILDANLNRAREGLRTAEDYARFILISEQHSGMLKQLRHRLFSVFSEDIRSRMLTERDSETDHGAKGMESGATKNLSRDVAAANIKRAEEALRSIEEYTKILSEETAGEIKNIRFALYTLEKEMFSLKSNLEKAKLYIILTESLCSHPYDDTVMMLADSGADIIQIREKNIEGGDLKERVQHVQQLLNGSEVLLTVNDRPDVARLTGADGVHGGQNDLSVEDMRTIFPRGFVGLSTHSPEQAEQANFLQPDYIGIGPVFATPTKEGRPGIGLENMKDMIATADMPGFVIGGITRDTADSVFKAGAERIAVCSAVISAEDPLSEMKFFRNCFT